MRNFIIVTFSVAMLSVACHEPSSLREVTCVEYIEFTLSTSAIHSRAVVAESYLDIDNIGIFGFVGNKSLPFADNISLERLRRQWCSSELFLWSDYNSDSTQFYCYTPYATAANGLTVSATPDYFELQYRAPAQACDQPYIMVAYPVAHNIDYLGAVQFVMQHPCCVVSFSSELGLLERVVVSGVVSQATLRVLPDGDYAWSQPNLSDYDIESTDGAIIVLPPQCVGSDGQVTLYVGGESSTFSLSGQSWGENQRVDYIVVADSLCCVPYST